MALILAMAAGFGLLIGAIFGAVQGLALMRGAERAWLWIAANALGWGVALPVIYAAASEAGGNIAAPAAAGAGLVAGLLLGLVTGAFLRWMPPKPADADD